MFRRFNSPHSVVRLDLANDSDRDRLSSLLAEVRPGSAIHVSIDQPTTVVRARDRTSFADVMRIVEATYYDAV